MNQSIEELSLRRSKRNVRSNSTLGESSTTRSVDLRDEEAVSRKRRRDGKQREGEKKK